jgi:hypothetical protein
VTVFSISSFSDDYVYSACNQRILAEFTRTGLFVSEETDNDHYGNFEDSTGNSDPKSSTVCEC